MTEQTTPIPKNIAAAFVKAQKEFGPALKTSTNPHFRSKYADLSACVEAVIDALNNNGIALIQRTYECNDGVMIETVFLHESGEVIEGGLLHFPAPKYDPQGLMSALTYARRGSLMAACGIAAEDDDGNGMKATKQSEISEDQIVDHINAILAAHDDESLRKTYMEAYKACGSDVTAQKRVIAAKDQTKKRLEKS